MNSNGLMSDAVFSRMVEIYTLLCEAPRGKDFLSKRFSCTTRTIENLIPYANGDIIYDKKRKVYCFASLLPDYIPFSFYASILKKSVCDSGIKSDIEHTLVSSSCTSSLVVSTKLLSPLYARILTFKLSINNNVLLRCKYKGVVKEEEVKYIKPFSLHYQDGIFYLYGKYGIENSANVGEERMFSVSRFEDVSFEKYISYEEEVFKKDVELSAFGAVSSASTKYIYLHLDSVVSHVYKKDGIFNAEQFRFIQEYSDETILVKMYYASIIEIERLAQRWMPHIKIVVNNEDDKKVKKEIVGNISKNFSVLFKDGLS